MAPMIGLVVFLNINSGFEGEASISCLLREDQLDCVLNDPDKIWIFLEGRNDLECFDHDIDNANSTMCSTHVTSLSLSWEVELKVVILL